jgi:hypothetical protein
MSSYAHYAQFGVPGLGRLRPKRRASYRRRIAERRRLADHLAAVAVRNLKAATAWPVPLTDKPWWERVIDWILKLCRPRQG